MPSEVVGHKPVLVWKNRQSFLLADSSARSTGAAEANGGIVLGRYPFHTTSPRSNRENGSTHRVTWEPNPFISTKNVRRKPYTPSGRGDGTHSFHPRWSPLNPRETNSWCPHRFPDSRVYWRRRSKKEAESLSHLFSDPSPYGAQLGP